MSEANKIFKEKIFEKIIDLPDYRLKEVVDFIEFLRSKKEEAEDPILNVAGCLSGKPITAKEIEEDLYGST